MTSHVLDSSLDRAQRIMGRAALVLGSILVVASIPFALVASVQIASVRLTWAEVNNQICEDSRIEYLQYKTYSFVLPCMHC